MNKAARIYAEYCLGKIDYPTLREKAVGHIRCEWEEARKADATNQPNQQNNTTEELFTTVRSQVEVSGKDAGEVFVDNRAKITDKTNPIFVKHDAGKIDYTLLPWQQLDEVVRVFAHGAEKYGRNNYLECENPERYLAAAMRHVVALMVGESIDKDSGLLAVGHAIASLLMYARLTDEYEQSEQH